MDIFFSIMLPLRYLLSSAFLLLLFFGFLLKNRKWKIASLFLLALVVAETLIEMFFGPGSKPDIQGVVENISIGIPLSLFFNGVPLLVLIGIPMALVIGFKKKDRIIKLTAIGLLVLGVIWYFVFGFWLDSM